MYQPPLEVIEELAVVEERDPVRPLVLAPNLMDRPYRGGSALAAFRGLAQAPGERCPEDWIASTTTVFGDDQRGLTALPDGTSLRAAVERDPAAYLSPEHRAVFGSSTGLLLKLIDAQQRLSVHIHPSRAFARRELGATYGKNEAWYVVATDGPDAVVHFGFTEPVDERELLEVVDAGQGGSLLDRMHAIPVVPGDAVFVPAGTPHAIGAGILLIEAQEPSDLLVRLEWSGYAVGSMPSDLGLGFDRALGAVDRTGWDADRLAGVRHRGSSGSVLPAAADGFFRLDQMSVRDRVELDADFSVLVVLDGSGELRADGSTTPSRTALSRGQAVLVPYGTGPVEVVGELDLVRARPADPRRVAELDPDLTALLALPA